VEKPLEEAYWFISTTTSITSLTQSLWGSDLPQLPVLLLHTATGYQNQAQARGLGDYLSCVSAVAGDFDNDMDQDIYAVCRGGVTNLENRLYENQGTGTFVRYRSRVVPRALSASVAGSPLTVGW